MDLNKLSVKMWTEFNRFDGFCARGDELSEDFVQCSGSFAGHGSRAV
jgi:hypothetical protein